MNDDAGLIKTAIGRAFARTAIPPCPAHPWHTADVEAVTIGRPNTTARTLAYAAALLVVATIAGIAAQASSTVKDSYRQFMAPFFVSTRPLLPGIHRADRLTIAQAQQRVPFPIVVPSGLPAHARFLYAHVIGERAIPRVALAYEIRVANQYYRVSIDESLVAPGPPAARFEVRNSRGGTKVWSLPVRRFRHGPVVMDLFSWGLPAEMSDQIVRANTR